MSTKGTKQEKKRFTESLRFRIMMMNFLAIVCASVVIMLVLIPQVKKDIRNDIKTTIFNMSTAYGKLLDEKEMDTKDNSYEFFEGILSDVTIQGMKTSYAYVVDSDGTMLYHPTKDKVGNPVENTVLKKLISRMKSGEKIEDAIMEYDFNGTKKYAGYHVTSQKEILVVTADEKDAFQEINVLQRISSGILVAICIVAMLVAFFVANSIAKPIMHVAEVIARAADFDFTEDEYSEKMLNHSGETGMMARAVAQMSHRMSEMVKRIDTVKNEIIEKNKALQKIGEEINVSCTDNSATTEELAASMQETSATTENINTNIEHMQTEAGAISQLSADGKEISEEIKTRAKNLQDKTQTAITRTNEMFQNVKDKTAVAMEQATAVDQIQQLTAAIMEIASQTNLLALNASIEAARAGEAGKGFAVVASEIGNLASQSSATVESIDTILGEISGVVKNMLDSLEDITEFMEKVVLQDYQQFAQVGDQYRADADVINGSMCKIEDSMKTLNSNMKEVGSAIEAINTTVGEAAVGVSDIAGKTTDVVSMTMQNEELASESIQTVGDLDQLIQQFTLEK